MRRFIVFTVLCCWPINAYALIINIPADYPTIQAGIDAAANGDTVLVAPGNYIENPNIDGKNILLTSGEGPEATVIIGYPEFRGDLDTTCVFRGFSVWMNVNEPFHETYSLIWIWGGAPIITGNIIEGNVCEQAGAGINASRSSAIIRGNIVRNNFTTLGGGGIVGSVGSVIEGNIISGNRAGYRICEGGGAGGISVGSGFVRYNLIVDNETMLAGCHTEGGGIKRGVASYSYIYNNTIVENSARIGQGHSLGGGIYFVTVGQDSNQFFKNNIIAFNPFGAGVYAIFLDSAYVEWDYNLLFGNGGGNYLGIEPGPHDIAADPMFVDRFSGDYQLLPNSPCIDAGDPSSPLDPDGTRADIGAYYFDQTVGIDDDGQPTGPYQFQLRQNYPNPFNSQTIISYYLPGQAIVSLHIFSITGHFVKALANKESQQPGEHEYTWNGTDRNGKEVSTGIYFYELYVDDHRESKPMIMIK